MAKLSVDDILDAIKELSIIEAADLSKRIEEEFGIQAAAPVAVGAAGPAPAAGPAEEAEEQTEFDLVLTSAGDKKIQVIKEVRALTNLGLKERRTWWTTPPSRCWSASPAIRPIRPGRSWRAPGPPWRSSNQGVGLVLAPQVSPAPSGLCQERCWNIHR